MNQTTRLTKLEASLSSFDLRRALSSPLDIVVGAALASVAALGMVSANEGLGGAIAVLLATAPHVMRHAHPWLTIGLTLLGAVLLLAVAPRLDFWAVPVFVSGLLSLYTLQRMIDRLAAWILGGIPVAVALAFAGLYYAGRRFGVHDSAEVAVAVIAAILSAGTTLLADTRRSRTEAREARADNVETLREQAAMAERARIAREMHDIVAHSISMVAVQAETAPYTIKDLSDEAKREFAEIATAARGTLTEMRRLLGVLRADVPPETAPQPGLARLTELIEQHGGQVDVDIVGEERELPQAVDVSAYRIVQEAFTNVRTHAPGSRVSIEVAYRPTLLALRIADDGPGPSKSEDGLTGSNAKEPPGHGLIGMRERATALGGWFVAGPGPAGGFLIQVGLPLE